MEPPPERGGTPPGEAEPPPGPLELRLRTVERELALVKAALGETLRSPSGAPPEPPGASAWGRRRRSPPRAPRAPPGAPGTGGAPRSRPRRGPPVPPRPGIPGAPPEPRDPPSAPSPAPRGPRKELLRRHSSSSGPPSPRQRLSRKAASSANLLQGSPESRPKEPTLSPASRRGNYNLEGVSVKMFLRGRPITMYVPSGLGLRAELPPERLQLDWVYGYRGRDSRSNLHVLGSGELVYFIACVVVLLQLPARRQRHYLRHSDCVRCLAVHPDRLRVATGQAAGVDKDGKPLQPIVHIWDSATLQTLQQIGLGSFERGVGSLAFSTAVSAPRLPQTPQKHPKYPKTLQAPKIPPKSPQNPPKSLQKYRKNDQGAFLCVVDDSNEHMMSVWDCARGTKLAEVKSTNESVLTVEFNPRDSSSIVSSGKSHVFFWSWSGGALTKKHGIFGKYKKPKFIQCFIFDAAGALLTGDSEGNILTWTRTPGKGGKEMYQIGQQTRAHEGSVFALCRRRDGTVLSGGGKDRRVLSWSPTLELLHEVELPESFGAVRTIAEGPGEELLVGTTRNALLQGTLGSGFTPIVQGHTDEVWGLATHPNCCRFLTCGHDRQLCLWDGHEHALAWSLALEDTGLCADFHPGGHVVAVGLLSGRWLVLDTGTRQLLAGGSDGNEQLSVVRFSPDGTFLAIGSHDNFIYIYSVAEGGRKFSRFGRCTGHSSFITHLDWSKDGRFIMSNSGDYEILYWDVAGGCKLLRNRFESRDREWASYTCVLGFHVFGVWPDGSDGTDINSLCRSHHERVVAVADDFCKVHLFQYPCARAKAPSHVYGGHGSHVTNVRFTHDDGHLVSLGGKDTSVFQWRVLPGDSA
ncbi:LOW QUALITY PROTEIN: echinoderm microtubule-associated protein-like 3 [Lonchura striata]